MIFYNIIFKIKYNCMYPKFHLSQWQFMCTYAHMHICSYEAQSSASKMAINPLTIRAKITSERLQNKIWTRRHSSLRSYRVTTGILCEKYAISIRGLRILLMHEENLITWVTLHINSVHVWVCPQIIHTFGTLNVTMDVSYNQTN